MCDLETSRVGAPYIYDISNLRVKSLTGMRTALFRVITQRVVVIPYRHFGTNLSVKFSRVSVEDGTDRLSRIVGKELPLLGA